MTTELIEQDPNTDIVITDHIASRLTRLRQQSSDLVEVWEPTLNETMAGVHMGSREVIGDFGVQNQLLLKDWSGSSPACVHHTVASALISSTSTKVTAMYIKESSKGCKPLPNWPV
ncbi:MAG: hypothetical protein HOF98_07220 [Gammaproteobacteria bacterium]|nr:hypothetical protein [Gammaproteobacteria bacterium]